MIVIFHKLLPFSLWCFRSLSFGSYFTHTLTHPSADADGVILCGGKMSQNSMQRLRKLKKSSSSFVPLFRFGFRHHYFSTIACITVMKLDSKSFNLKTHAVSFPLFIIRLLEHHKIMSQFL